ncbi:hypothetical protein GTR02_04270 [Kineococcus sp. R8]|uniref:hypothetical protein n=1 Tax=Kineococcus siccus TaxID=2696567 RepID=UPI0014131C83|nr:hypothetical protein [Kineococcus siccus]NAZ81030.1 hypothetical protein [Kineococcus siccus]
MKPEAPWGGVPSEVAVAVASFLRARLGEAERWGGVSARRSADWRDQLALIREWEQASARGRRVTADNLALTMLASAARYRTHRGYDPAWDAWTPFGDLDPQRRQR